MDFRVLVLHSVTIKVVREVFLVRRARSLDQIDFSSRDCLKSGAFAKLLIDLLLSFLLRIETRVTCLICHDRGFLVQCLALLVCGGSLIIRCLLLNALQKLFGRLDLGIDVHRDIIIGVD